MMMTPPVDYLTDGAREAESEARQAERVTKVTSLSCLKPYSVRDMDRRDRLAAASAKFRLLSTQGDNSELLRTTAGVGGMSLATSEKGPSAEESGWDTASEESGEEEEMALLTEDSQPLEGPCDCHNLSFKSSAYFGLTEYMKRMRYVKVFEQSVLPLKNGYVLQSVFLGNHLRRVCYCCEGKKLWSERYDLSSEIIPDAKIPLPVRLRDIITDEYLCWKGETLCKSPLEVAQVEITTVKVYMSYKYDEGRLTRYRVEMGRGSVYNSVETDDRTIEGEWGRLATSDLVYRYLLTDSVQRLFGIKPSRYAAQRS